MRIAVIALVLAVILVSVSLLKLMNRVKTLEYCLYTPLDVRDFNKCR